MTARLVCLDVTDPDGYEAYRRAMAPILARHGGRFVLDVAATPAIHPAGFTPNRVIVIAFETRAAADAFFADPAYVDARARWFVPSVAASSVTWLP